MSVKRKLKTVYKNLLVKIAKSRIGASVCAFLSSSATIMLAETGKKRRSEISERLMVSKLIVSIDDTHKHIPYNERENKEYKTTFSENSKKISKKILVRVVHCHPNTITAMESLCEAFQNDNQYDLKIILTIDSGTSYALVKQMEERGFAYVFDNEYNIAIDKPDIIIFYNLESNYAEELFAAHNYSRMVVLVPLTLTTIWYGERSISRCHLDKFKPNIMFATDLVMKKIPKSSKYKLLKMTPPQIDAVYRVLQNKKKYPTDWDKLQSKKIILYMTDHGLRQYAVSDEVSFDIYIGTLLNYAKEHEDVGLIIRPHFALIGELFAWYWSLNDYRSFIEFCDNSPNIIWDESQDFMTALSVCDAVVSDINTSVTYFSLASMKPIAIPIRYDMNVEINNEYLLENLYTLRSREDCIKFMDMIKNGNDPMKNKRQELFNNLIEPFDGKNGERIKEAIEREYQALGHFK